MFAFLYIAMKYFFDCDEFSLLKIDFDSKFGEIDFGFDVSVVEVLSDFE